MGSCHLRWIPWTKYKLGNLSCDSGIASCVAQLLYLRVARKPCSKVEKRKWEGREQGREGAREGGKEGGREEKEKESKEGKERSWGWTPGRISASPMVDYISQEAEGPGRVSTLTHSSTSRRPY